MKAKRIQWLDFARGIAILLVVCGHSLGSIGTTDNYKIDPIYFKFLTFILFTVEMPCFFGISGYLYKPIHTLHKFWIMLYKKSISLVIPYILFSIIYIFIKTLGGNGVNHITPLSSIFKIYSTPAEYLWFLYALFLIFIIIGIFDLLKISKTFQLLLCFILMCISIIFPNNLWPGIEDTFNNIIYFYIGFLLSNSSFNRYISCSSQHIITYILSFLFISSLIIQAVITYVYNSPNIIIQFITIITQIISILLFFQISRTFPHNKLFSYFDKYGKVTLIIYLVHAPVISILRVIYFKLLPVNSINIFILSIALVIISWYTSIFIYYLSRRFNIINFIFYPRKRYISKWILKTKIGEKFLS